MNEVELTQEEKDHAGSLLVDLDRSRAKLQELAQDPITNILGNEQELAQIKYNLIIAIQTAIDTCYHFVAKLDSQAPKNYAHCFNLSAKLGIIDLDLVKDLEHLAHFRNLLISGDTDDELVCDVLKNKLTSLDIFKEQVQCFIAKCRPFKV